MPPAIINIAGKVHVSKQPPFISYNPQFHLLKGHEIRSIFNCMQPGDIFLRRHNGYISGLAIPGYYMHAALYMGNNIAAHATTKGVVTEDVLDFFRCDCTAHLRVKGVTPSMVSNAITKAKRMVKLHLPYDYDFQDLNGKIYCTELINIVYDNCFNNDYTKDAGGGISLSPDGLFESRGIEILKEYRH